MPKRTKRYEDGLYESLKDPKEAVAYLNAHFDEDGEDSQDLFLLALRDVAKAHGFGDVPNRRWFSWQEGYGAFSVSRSQEEAVIEYIRNQQEHHRRQDFQQELLELLRRHGIEYDPRYVFD
jgi:DNA-binding phage protein